MLAAQAGGFTIAAIAELPALFATEECDCARGLTNTRIMEIDDKIAELRTARKSLRCFANECAEGAQGKAFPYSVGQIRKSQEISPD